MENITRPWLGRGSGFKLKMKIPAGPFYFIELNLIDRINDIAKDLGLDGKIVEIAQMVLNDERPKLQHTYVFANTKYNQDSEFEAVAEMKKAHLASKFIIIGGENHDGFSGYKSWERDIGQKIGYENVMTVPLINTSNVNTLSESQSVINYTRDCGIDKLYIVAATFHQLRAFMTSASVAIQKHEGLSIFNYPGIVLPWDEVVTHSQGVLKATREQWIQHELDRIKKYQIQEDILPTHIIFEYLNNRKT